MTHTTAGSIGYEYYAPNEQTHLVFLAPWCTCTTCTPLHRSWLRLWRRTFISDWCRRTTLQAADRDKTPRILHFTYSVSVTSSGILTLVTQEATVSNLRKTTLFLLGTATFLRIVLSIHGTLYLIILSLHQRLHASNIDLYHWISVCDVVFIALFLFFHIGHMSAQNFSCLCVLLTWLFFSLAVLLIMYVVTNKFDLIWFDFRFSVSPDFTHRQFFKMTFQYVRLLMMTMKRSIGYCYITVWNTRSWLVQRASRDVDK